MTNPDDLCECGSKAATECGGEGSHRCWIGNIRLETAVLRALADAMDNLYAATDATESGFIADHIGTVVSKLKHVMRIVIDD